MSVYHYPRYDVDTSAPRAPLCSDAPDDKVQVEICTLSVRVLNCTPCADRLLSALVARRIRLARRDANPASVEWILDALVKHQHDAERPIAKTVSFPNPSAPVPVSRLSYVCWHRADPTALPCLAYTPFAAQARGGAVRFAYCDAHGGEPRALAELQSWYAVHRNTLPF